MNKFKHLLPPLGSILLMLGGLANAASEIRSGVLIDPEMGTAYVMHPEGGVDALDVRSGRPKWHSGAADKPIAWADGHLLGLVESRTPGNMGLVVINTENGSIISRKSVKLPADVTARIDDGMGTSFRIDSRIPGNPVTVGWEYSHRLVQGVKEFQPRPVQQQQGGVQMDLLSGSLTELAPAMVPKKQRQADIEGQYLASVAGRQFRSSDGAHVLVSRPVEGGDTHSHDWTVYELGGRLLGQSRLNVSYSPFAVVDGVLMLVSNPIKFRDANGNLQSLAMRLQGIELSSGKEIWAVEIRDTVYRGPFPP